MSAALAAELLAEMVDAAPRKMLLFSGDGQTHFRAPHLIQTQQTRTDQPCLFKKKKPTHNPTDPGERGIIAKKSETPWPGHVSC